MIRWHLALVPLMATVGTLFLMAHLVVAGLGLWVLAAVIPQIRSSLAAYGQMCERIHQEPAAAQPLAVQKLNDFDVTLARAKAGERQELIRSASPAGALLS